MEFRLKGEVPAEKRNIFIFIGLRCDKDSLPSDEKLKKKTKKKPEDMLCLIYCGTWSFCSSRLTLYVFSAMKKPQDFLDVVYCICY